MHQPFFNRSRISLAILAIALQAHAAHAEETVADVSLPVILVEGGKSILPANLPSTVEGVNARQIAESINAITAAETLNYLPSVHVRERYIGDRNGILVMRVNSSVASAQTTVYADNLLLSNFLNNSFSTAPRWGLVAPEEIERVDVLYGPFSALYPGNSAGGVVLMTTHMPDKFAFHAKTDLFAQNFRLYGTDQQFKGAHGSIALGNKVGDWSFWSTLDHLDNHSQPQTFGAATAAVVTGAPAFTSVTGERRDFDTSGNPRIITSAIGADHTVQDNGKIKLAYDLAPGVRAAYTLGLWQNKSDTGVSNYLQDASGTAVYNTTAAGATRYVKFAGDNAYYTLAGTAPGYAESEHYLHGLSLRNAAHTDWQWEAVASLYDEHRDISRTAVNNTSLFDSGNGTVRPAGTLTVGDGTGWVNVDLRGDWRPEGDAKDGHKISAGYHADRYTLASITSAVAGDWRNGAATTTSSNSYGKTATQALYLQDAWQFLPQWLLIAGGRLEHWRAYDGSNFNAANSAQFRQLNYAGRSSTNFSPKLSLSYAATPDWTLRTLFGTAVRYPTVAEIFQVINLPNNVKQNDPNLRPERVHAGELSVERALPDGVLRTSLFWENKRDALISQSDTTVVPNISSIQNVDRVRTWGVESAFDLRDVMFDGLSLNGSITYANSTITADRRNPGLVGTDQPRIPDWRATLVATYHASERLSYSVSYRYSGRQHNALYNTVTHAYNDVNPNVYGAASHYSVVDAKVLYRFTQQWSGALGINNLGDFKHYVNPNPYPQRTLFASAKFDY